MIFQYALVGNSVHYGKQLFEWGFPIMLYALLGLILFDETSHR
jgi:hypothetical protein